METVLLQITNNKAYKLLKDLEDLHIIKVLEKHKKSSSRTKSSHGLKRLSKKYAGKLPADIADQLQEYVSQSRSEWNNRNI